MAMKIREIFRDFNEIPKFVKVIEENHGVHGGKVSNIKEIIEEVFVVSVKRGLTDDEFSLLLRFFCKGSISISDKLKLLQNVVPGRKAPDAAIQQFMAWLITNLSKDEGNFRVIAIPRILQWIIGLLEHNLVDSREIDNFYHEFYYMLGLPHLLPYAAKLLCKLTKPDDVTSQTVSLVYKAFLDPSNKYILALLNVFQGYKPHLMPEDVKKVDVHKILNSVSHSMDLNMRVRVISMQQPQLSNRALGICEVPTRNSTYFKDELNRPSTLIPLPIYNLEGTEKFRACYPNSVEEAFRKFSQVTLPQNIMSILQNDTGFFMILYQSIELQMRFQNRLLQTLQNAMIYGELKSSDDDVEYLLTRVYHLQTFMRQGIPSVSVFLSGYLLDWDGIDHRYRILKLIEFATFHSFRELGCNILRPLHLLFVTYDASMKRDIIQALVNLIKNMFFDVSRSQQGIPFPFLKRGPKWTKYPLEMLTPLINWTQGLITLGLNTESDSTVLLLESIRFYSMINSLQVTSGLPMFTVVSEGVVLQSLSSSSPNTIIKICLLFLRYQKELLPQLRQEQPHFYKKCKEEISLISNYAQQIIDFLQNGQVVLPRKENGIIVRDVPTENMTGVELSCLTSHTCFVTTFLSFESWKHDLNLLHPMDRRKCVEVASVHLKEITEFVNCFSPRIPESSQ